MAFRLRFGLLAAAVLSAGLWLGAREALADPLSPDAIPGAAESQPIPELVEAQKLFVSGDREGALKQFEAAQKSHPELPPAPVLMAQLSAQTNMPAAVRPWIERAVKDYPNDPEAYLILGASALSEGRVTEADLLLTKARSLVDGFTGSPQRKTQLNQRTLTAQADVQELRENWPAAQALLEKWLKDEPQNVRVIQRLAHAKFQQKDAEGALKLLQQAKEIDPKVMQPEARLAEFYENAGDHENASKSMNEAIAKAPNDLTTQIVAGQWALQTDQLDLAKQQAVKALKLDPKSVDANLLRGSVALFNKDYKDAETYFEAASMQSPNSFAASNNLALALAEQPDTTKQQRALDFASRNAQLYPNQPDAASTLGWVLYKLNRREDAERVLAAAARAGGPIKPDTAYYIARLSVDRDRKDVAKQVLQMALHSNQPFLKRDEAQALLNQLDGKTAP